jgi:hypothetical protein
VLVAAVAILEGYRWLNVLPSVGWRPSAIVFTSLAVPLAMVVTRGHRGEPGGPGGQRWPARAVTGAALLVVPLTVITLIHPQAPIAQLMGSTDLLFAVAALVAVLINERTTHSSRRAGGTSAGGEPAGSQRRADVSTVEPSRSDGRRDRLI